MKKGVLTTLLLLVVSTSMQGRGVPQPPDFTKLPYDKASQAVDDQLGVILYLHATAPGPEYFGNLDSQLQYGHLNNGSKVLAIYLLGSLRTLDLQSINILIENIDFKAEKFDRLLKTRISVIRWGLYPAQEALIKIGKPTIAPISNHLPIETNELRRRLLCDVLRKVEGSQSAQAQVRQKLAETATNLDLTLKELQKAQ
ncbi:MAG TPA: hypothetical protein VH619_15580 [Verrucomicrobiae bacterium]|jgi:hypothetical protein|nr:hypothetical protein [Verrucomicrobiae bacterium]